MTAAALGQVGSLGEAESRSMRCGSGRGLRRRHWAAAMSITATRRPSPRPAGGRRAEARAAPSRPNHARCRRACALRPPGPRWDRKIVSPPSRPSASSRPSPEATTRFGVARAARSRSIAGQVAEGFAPSSRAVSSTTGLAAATLGQPGQPRIEPLVGARRRRRSHLQVGVAGDGRDGSGENSLSAEALIRWTA